MKLTLLSIAVLAYVHLSFGQDDVIVAIPVAGGLSGSGTTTRYWDCCKPSCGWAENLSNKNDTPVATCTVDGKTPTNASIQSGCNSGTSYVCSDQEAIVINSTFAIGFAAGSFTGGIDYNFCCSCFLLSFQDSLSNKQFLVQVTNTGGDLGQNQFDLAIPGGGVGIFTEGCSTQWGTPSNGWGDQYGGVSSEADCAQLPEDLQDGCKFRFEFLDNVSNPPVTFVQVECPSQLISITNCTNLLGS